MAKKERTFNPAPGDVGHSFDRDDTILNFRPTIAFVQPPPEEGQGQEDFFPIDEPEPSLDDARNRINSLIKGYEAAKQLAEVAQSRITNRVKAAGGLDVKLDTKKDATVIAAIKRHFPTKADPTVITYDDYRDCLKDLAKLAPSPLTVSDNDIRAAKANPLKTDFGGLGTLPGLNRLEINTAANSIEPLDLEAFQAAGVATLFQLMLPLLKKLISPI